MLDVLAKGYLGPEYSWALQSSVRTLAAEISTFFDRELFSHPDYSIGRLVTDNPALIHGNMPLMYAFRSQILILALQNLT